MPEQRALVGYFYVRIVRVPPYNNGTPLLIHIFFSGGLDDSIMYRDKPRWDA